MKVLMTTVLVVGLLLATGCGVNKEYVQQQIAESESRTGAQVGQLQAGVDANEQQIQQLQALGQQLSEKTDLALNKASGFENYQVLWDNIVNFDFDQYELTELAK
ncbi:MAG TPA: hypothetical protein PKY95_02290, partial [candidate division Zixibacteria bacterium]|nr:hypothetical protein [candidate division Zixibacteria bacterium]